MKIIARMSVMVLLLSAVSLTARLSSSDFRPRQLPVKPDEVVVPPGYDHRHVEVKFLDDADIGLSAEGQPYDRSNQLLKDAGTRQTLTSIAAAGGTWRRMSPIKEEEADRLRKTAEGRLERGIADLNNYFMLTVPQSISTEDWLENLNSLPEVEIARAMPLPMPPPVVPGNYQSLQGYLNDATDGIGAASAWALPGGTGWPSVGGPVRIMDFEYSWNLNHDDLPYVASWPPPGYIVSDPFNDDNHGTAVLGEMHSLNNGWGTTGASYAATAHVAPTFLDSSWQLGTAMLWVLSAVGPGDIFLIEQQMAGPNYDTSGATQDGLIPVEWWESWYNIIVTAVGNGINVVEAAGNGRENLDDPVYSTGNGGHWPFLSQNNSGAIIVGAGAAPAGFGGSDVDRSRLWFSNWGSRIDVQGWGERVMTIGYGDYYAAEGKDLWYTSTFDGTSSASPIVASAVALLESIYRENNGGSHLSPGTVRSVLISTGSPQQAGTYPVSQHIGPRPDLQAAIAATSFVCGDADGNGIVNVSDAVYLISYIFAGGPPPSPLLAGDADCNGIVNVSDAVYLIAYIFGGGPAPCANCP